MRPIEGGAGAPVPSLVNQRAPSGPAVMPAVRSMFGSAEVDTTPAVVMRPIEGGLGRDQRSSAGGGGDRRVGAGGHAPGGGGAPDRGTSVGEPQGAVGPGGDPRWVTDAPTDMVGHDPGGGDAPDRGRGGPGSEVGKPEGTVGP